MLRAGAVVPDEELEMVQTKRQSCGPLGLGGR